MLPISYQFPVLATYCNYAVRTYFWSIFLSMMFIHQIDCPFFIVYAFIKNGRLLCSIVDADFNRLGPLRPSQSTCWCTHWIPWKPDSKVETTRRHITMPPSMLSIENCFSEVCTKEWEVLFWSQYPHVIIYSIPSSLSEHWHSCSGCILHYVWGCEIRAHKGQFHSQRVAIAFGAATIHS